MNEIKIKIRRLDNGYNFAEIVDVETNGRLFYEEISCERARHFVLCWNSHDTLLAVCQKTSVIKQWIMRIKNAPKELYRDIGKVEEAIEAGEK